jgi:hypothetical protein
LLVLIARNRPYLRFCIKTYKSKIRFYDALHGLERFNQVPIITSLQISRYSGDVQGKLLSRDVLTSGYELHIDCRPLLFSRPFEKRVVKVVDRIGDRVEDFIPRFKAG